ncbi:lipid kinase [Brasilonema bromeliae]|uniref:Lipid kinase n=1 Tax=Brasilonema bromeliae SPC951 TaxID=385972 RepID=A0ABX1PBK4_9CYAN|nr:lipid kinase [Brasilonema bromeliae]NMG21835.1 lipid kinase [Brasilonema bromeliae SPC951]
MTRRALLLVNRHARRGQHSLPQAVKQLRELGFDLIEEDTEKPNHLREMIHRHRNQVDLVIIGGGDGTLNAAVDALVETQLPLGILPLGTANDLARTLGIPPTLPDACQTIAKGELQRIDLGWVNGKHFFNVASLGLSVQITERLNQELKRRWGVLAYAATALGVIWQARLFRADIRLDGELIRVKTVQIAVGNGRYYGGGMIICENAAINDQKLHLSSINVRHWWQIVALLPAMKQGRHKAWSGIHTDKCQEIEVYTYRLHAINTDGELTTNTPAKFRLIPKALSVLIPRKYS